jgi:uncharacterized Zn-finger protein
MPYQMDSTLTRTCAHCGTAFLPKRAYERPRFCGRPCLYAYQREHPEQWGGVPKVALVCSYCGVTYTCVLSRVRGKTTNFCSRRCMALFRSPLLREHPHLVGHMGGWVKSCEWCGAEYRVVKPRDMAVRRYCSEACGRRAHKPKMLGTGNPNYRHGQNQKAARDTAIRHGRTACIICGWNIAVDLHHILPKHKGGRISEDNIAILCPNHHRMAHLGLLTPEALTEHVQASLKTPTG